MLAVAALPLLGHAEPRIAPPLPLRHDLAGYRETSAKLGIVPMPWQETAACYATALDADDLWLYRDFAAVVGRQNGKTTFCKPLIIQRLLANRKIMHIAQVRELPRLMFETIADYIETYAPELLPRRRGKVIWPRRGFGSESIVLEGGGEYRISSALTGGRGFSFDDLLIDELRAMDTFDVINSAKPAQRFSKNPQTIYLSNAGTDASVILNSLRVRGASADPSLAYLEWSADPAYAADDRRGWVQANPSIGHYPQVLRDLEKEYVSALLAGNLAGFETEALCRWVSTLRERLVDGVLWKGCEAEVTEPVRPALAVAMDPSGTRASAFAAWPQPDGTIALRVVEEAVGSPINVDKLGKVLRTKARELHVTLSGYDPMTDAMLAKYLPRATKIAGQTFANASSRFVSLVESKRLQWSDAASVGDDLTWTTRKPHDESGSYQAVRSDDERPITSALAAIRAVWLASEPKPVPSPSSRSSAVGF